eukprot:scaffold215162_cov41-Prasinocladus_malaysianus.AAC.1
MLPEATKSGRALNWRALLEYDDSTDDQEVVKEEQQSENEELVPYLPKSMSALRQQSRSLVRKHLRSNSSNNAHVILEEEPTMLEEESDSFADSSKVKADPESSEHKTFIVAFPAIGKESIPVKSDNFFARLRAKIRQFIC